MKGNYLIASSLFLYVPSQGNNTSNANNIPFNYLFTQQIFIRFWLRASTALGTLLFAVWSKWKIHQTRAFKTQWREKLHFGMAMRTLTPFRKPRASAEFILQPAASSTAEGNQSSSCPEQVLSHTARATSDQFGAVLTVTELLLPGAVMPKGAHAPWTNNRPPVWINAPHSLRSDEWSTSEAKLYFAEWAFFAKLRGVLF